MRECGTLNTCADQPAKMLWQRPHHPFANRLLRFSAVALLLLLLLEVFVFNYRSFRLWFGSYTAETYGMHMAEIEGLTPDPDKAGVYRAESAYPTVTFDVNQKVGVLRLDVQSLQETRYILYADIFFTDEAHADYIESPAYLEILQDTPRTQYKTCYFSGDTDKLKFRLHVDVGEQVVLNGLQINHAVPMQFSMGRVAILWLLTVGVYIFLKAPSFGCAYSPFNRAHRWTPVAITALFLLLLWGIFAIYNTPYIHLKAFTSTTGDQITQELVDAFEAGQVHLLEEPSADLLALENPYEWAQRETTGVDCLWDHLLYEGRYYSYYGITPVLVFALPYHLLTGYYIPTNYTVLFCSLLGSLFLSAAYCRLMQKRFANVPFRLSMCGLIMVLMTTGIQFAVYRPLFYELAEACGFMFFALGLYWLASSGLLKDRPIRLHRLALSSVSISLAVLSRPTFAVYAVAAVIWLWFGLKPYRRQQSTPDRKRHIVKYVLAALLPYLLFGGLQMTYNYLRFGSVLDFGIQYSLTINDFTATEFHGALAAVSLYNLLLALPQFHLQFPYIQGTTHLLETNGYYFMETGWAIGLLWRALPLGGLAYAPRLLKKRSWVSRLRIFAVVGLPTVVFPLLLIVMTWESGYALRYSVDFAWQLVLGGLLVCLAVYGGCRSARMKQFLSTALVVATLWCCLSTMALVLVRTPDDIIVNNRPLILEYYRLARVLTFWK